MIDVPLVRHYAIPADRIRGWLLIILGNCLLVIGLLGAIVFDYY